MNNILFFLTPKAMCAFLYDEYTVRQALEKMDLLQKSGGKKVKVKVTQLCLTLCDPWTIQSMEFSRPEYWSG